MLRPVVLFKVPMIYWHLRYFVVLVCFRE